MVIYCQKEHLELIKTVITTKTQLRHTDISASMSTEQRMLSLLNFSEGMHDILISTDLTCRGIDFGKPIDTIISFDIGDKQSEVSRMCRMNRPHG